MLITYNFRQITPEQIENRVRLIILRRQMTKRLTGEQPYFQEKTKRYQRIEILRVDFRLVYGREKYLERRIEKKDRK